MTQALGRLLRRLRGALGQDRRERELDDELRFHLDEEADERRDDGLPSLEAERAARRSLGNLALIKEDSRAAWTRIPLDDVTRDIRHAWRGLRRAPAFTAAAVLTFALGIGLATAMFAVVDNVLFEPLPFRDSGQIVRLTTTPRTADGRPPTTVTGEIRVDELLELRARSRTLASAAVYVTDFRTLTGAGPTARLEGWRVEPELFEVLGARPLLGRVFDRNEVGVILLSEGTWRDQFGSAPDVIGRSVLLDGAAYTVVGVMPASFEFPFELSNRQYWRALRLSTDSPADLDNRLPMVARLADGVTTEAAVTEITAILNATTSPDHSYELVRLQDEIVQPVRRALLVLLFGVGGVLLIACVNVANLLLSRGVVRDREIAVRLALGASRLRIVRHLVVEGVILAIFGAVVGVALAAATLAFVTPLATTLVRMDVGRLSAFPRLSAVALDGPVVLAAFVTSVIVGIALGLVPALRAIASPTTASLRVGGTAATSDLRLTRGAALRPMLVIAEVALAVVLVISSGLLLSSFVRLATAPLGYEPERVLTFQVAMPPGRYASGRIQTFAEDLVARLDGLPEVESTAYAPLLPMVTLLRDTARFRTVPQPLDEPRQPADFRAVSPQYFKTMGIRVVAGRGFSDDDRPDGQKVVVINRALARRDFAGENPIGRNIYLSKDVEPWQVVGVIDDVRQQSLGEEPAPQVFISLRQSPMATGMRLLQYYAVRTVGDPLSLVPRVRDALRGVDADAALYNIAPMSALVANSVSRPRLYAVLAGVGSGVALALSAVGLYGVLSYLVAARTREFGVRLALGASPFDVCGIVIRRGLALTGIGLALGLGGAVAVARSLDGMLYGLAPLDPATFALSAALFAAVAALACVVPAFRATLIDPATSLRSE